MKNLMLITALLVMSQASMAFQATSQTLAYTAAEIIVTTAVTVASSEVSTLASQLKKQEAQKIERDAQDYILNGSLSPYLEGKIAAVKTLDASLSDNESVDVLLEATKIILAE
jgi:ABC-type transporter MlaC component